MKTKIFFILVALLVLGYLHLLTMYASRIDSRVSGEPGLPVITHSAISTSNSILISRPRLSDTKARRQMKQARQTVDPIVHPIQGKPMDTETIVHLDNPQTRAQRILYIITPTHKRLTQRADLTRLRQTLQLASLQHHANIYWILIEDAEKCSQNIRSIAKDSGLAFAHQAIASSDTTEHRGLAQRNLGLDIVEQIGNEGVVYFADDDNAYDIQLFTELTFTRYASVFAVGMSGGSAWERCHVHEETGFVDKILTTWKPRYRVPVPGKPGKFQNPVRKYGIDMAGFALSTAALLTSKARFQEESTQGMLETDFLSLLVKDVSELEPLAANCTRILVWHVKTKDPDYFNNPEADEETFELMKNLL
jgi:Glycosyltransferase family 43